MGKPINGLMGNTTGYAINFYVKLKSYALNYCLEKKYIQHLLRESIKSFDFFYDLT